MFQNFNKAVDKLPLAGKYSLGPAMKSYIRARPESHKLKYAATATLLGAFVLGHAKQAEMGIMSFYEHFEDAIKTGNDSDKVFMAVDIGYACINSAVTIRQVNLLRTLESIRKRKSKRPTQHYDPVTSKESKARAPISAKACLTAFAVTLAGQGIFFASAHDAENKKETLECTQEAESFFKHYQAYNDEGVPLKVLRNQWATWCNVSPTDIEVPNENDHPILSS